MEPRAWLATGVAVAAVALLVLELWTPEVVFIGALTLLMLFGVITPVDALSGFGSTALLTIAALLIVGAAIRRTGVLAAVADRVLGRRTKSEPLARLMVPAAMLSPFVNNTPIVAMFAPAIIDWCKRNDTAPSRMLMPLSFATMLGGMCTLIGTSTTLIVHGLMLEHGMEGLSMFEIGKVGLPIAVGGILLIWLLARAVLPDRRDPVRGMDSDVRSYLVEMLVDDTSPMIGQSISDAGLRQLPGLFLMNIERGGVFIGPVAPSEPLAAGDRLIFTGVASTVVDLRRFPGLSPAPEAHYDPSASERRTRMFEAVVSRLSPLVNTTIRDIGFRSRYDAAVLAVHRAGQRLPMKIGDVILRPGDTLMIEAGEDFDRRWSDALDFALVSRVRAEPLMRSRKASIALGVVVALVLVVTMGWLPMVVAAFLAAFAMLVTRVVDQRDVRKAVELPLLVIVGGAIGLGRALEISGAAAAIAEGAVSLAAGLGPHGILAVFCVLTVLLAAFVSNVAAVAMMFPIAMAVAANLGVNPFPFAMALCICGTSSFMTPFGYQTNLMIYGPGGYRFHDFLRLGVPLTFVVLFGVVTLVPLMWPF